MVGGQLNALVAYLRRVAVPCADGGATDEQLLERFTIGRDETAFAALLGRHGPLVWGVCRRHLAQTQDAEDAFQATFLILVRKASSISKRSSLRSWLYGVACRVAVRARGNDSRRQQRERLAPVRDGSAGTDDLVWRDLRPVLDEEIDRLPEKHRLPLILCYLEGKTNDEAAEQLGCPRGTIATRLNRAREQLRHRLTRRGLALSAGGLAAVLTANAGAAEVPAPLTEGLLRVVSGGAAAAGASARVAALTHGVIHAMFLTKLKNTLAALAVLGVLTVGASLLTYGVLTAQPPDVRADEPEKAPDEAPKARDEKVVPKPAPAGSRQMVPGQREGILLFLGTDVKPGEAVAPADLIRVEDGNPAKTYRRLKEGDRVEPGQLLGRIDDRLARNDLAVAEYKVVAAEAEQKATLKARDEAEQRYQTLVKVQTRAANSVSQEELRAAKLTWDRFFFEEISKRQAIEVAKRELERAQIILQMHELRSSIRGTIRHVYKQPGEGVRSLESVLLIEGDK